MSTFSFNLKLGNDANKAVTATLEETVAAVKLRMPPDFSGRWIYKGRILADTLQISETGISAGECVIVVRPSGSTQAQPQAPSPSSPATPTPTPSSHSASYFSPAMGASRAPLTAAMDVAMGSLLGNSEDAVAQCLSTIVKILQNISHNPHEAKFRQIPASNRAFDAKVGSVPGGPQLMMALGFELSPAGQWVLQPSAERWEVLQACHAKLSAFVERLRAGSGAQPAPPVGATAPAAPAAPAPAAASAAASGTPQPGSAGAPPQGGLDPAVLLLLASLAVSEGGSAPIDAPPAPPADSSSSSSSSSGSAAAAPDGPAEDSSANA